MQRLMLFALLIWCLSQAGTMFGQTDTPNHSWEELLKVRQESYARLREIKDTISRAAPDERSEMAEEYAGIVKTMQNETLPQLAKQIPDKLSQDPGNKESNEIVLEIVRYAYQSHDEALQSEFVPQIASLMAELLVKFPDSETLSQTALELVKYAFLGNDLVLRGKIDEPLTTVFLERLANAPDDDQLRKLISEIMGYAYQRNDYRRAKRTAKALLKADPQNSLAVNISGVSSFAEHDFAEANRLLTAADERGQLLQEVGANYLETSKSYIEYWKKEQEIRTREAEATGDEQLPRVLMKTSQGDILLELFENEAPNTVANFMSLVEKGFYDGQKFHRVLPGFMAQGGDPLSRNDDPATGSAGPGYRIKCECFRPEARRHFSGSLSMAHSGPDTGGSQFFLTHLPTPHLDREIGTSQHTVFGRVVEGLDVVRALQKNAEIISVEVVRKRDHEYEPETLPE